MSGRSATNVMARFSRVLNIPTAIGDQGASATYELPGWSFTDFCRTGKLGLWNIGIVLETQRIIGYKYPHYIYSDLPRAGEQSGTMPVLVAQRMHITRTLYDQASLSYPMVVKVAVEGVGKTSILRTTEARAKATGDLLATILRRSSFIDVQTRKAVPIPDRFATLPAAEQDIRVTVQDAPKSCHVYSLQIQACDIDQLGHMYTHNYIRYCMDAAYDAVVCGALRQFTKDICEYEVDTHEIRLLKESFRGDIIIVHVWEDDEKQRTLNFLVTNKGEPVVFCSMLFYPDLETETDQASKL